MRRLAVLVVWMLVLGVAAAGFLSSAPAAEAQTAESLCDVGQVEQFADVAAGDYAAAYVLCMRALGLSVGTSGGSYGPDRELNRGQMATFLVRLWRDVLGNDCPSGVVTPFTDVDAGSTHAANIDCLYGLELTTGTGADTYSPQDPLKASQITRFLYRTYRKVGGDMCAGTDVSELARATECLVQLRVVPTSGEATATTAVIRSQMGVYMVGLWHNLTGRGLPPPPPQLGAPTSVTTTTTTQPATQSTQRIAYVAGGQQWVADADGTNPTKLADAVRSFGRWAPDSTRIAYYTYRSGAGVQLWVADADGTNPTKLADAVQFFGRWAPDSTRIAYSTNDGLWVVGADGTNPTKLHDPVGPYLDWALDSTRIAYFTYRSGAGVQWWVADADGTNPTKLPDSTSGIGWAPDRTRITYTDSDDQLWVADADGTNPTKLADNAVSAGSLFGSDSGWAPDSTRIAYYIHRRGAGVQFWVADADGTNPTKLPDNFRRFGWVPDSARITYLTFTNGGQLWVADADGTNPTKLADNVFADKGQDSLWKWAPDSTRIAFTNGGQLWVADADGTNPTKLADNFLADHAGSVWLLSSWDLGWAPDSTRIAYTDSDDQLWVADADGTNPTKLADNVANHSGGNVAIYWESRSWEWAPDSTRIAYTDSDDQLWVTDADGTNPTKLADDVFRGYWAWAPDSTR